MSQIVTRKGPVGEDKEKRQTDSPVRDMKKKIAANAEKEKQAAEKLTPNEKNAEKSEKTTDRREKDKSIEKDRREKEKSVDKKERDKSTEKKEKSVEKKEKAPEKSPEKKDKTEKKETEKKETEKAKDDKDKTATKGDHTEEKKKPEEKSKQNGARMNGEQNGGTVSSEDDDLERDEVFPELAYDDSDGEGFERPTPEGLPSRSHTRRSQVKAARTPETPRPASDKMPDVDESKEKVLKLKDDSIATDRKLRSADSPKPEKKDSPAKGEEKKDSPAKGEEKKDSPAKGEEKKDSPAKGEQKKESEKTIEVQVVVDVENEDEARKPDTNYSRSRVKVSPYRRSTRHADVTCSSTAANYTGNNTTMEMDITETSLAEGGDGGGAAAGAGGAPSPYLSGLRAIRARRSYRALADLEPRLRRAAGLPAGEPVRPTGTVVGRKRKPEGEGEEAARGGDAEGADSKRPRLLQRLARPFRARAAPRLAEIVGINSDLPLTAPVACSDAFDPEAITPEPIQVTQTSAQTSALTVTTGQKDKRCVIQ